MKSEARVCIGIQARSTSKRLPNKISQLIGGKMVIDHVIDACRSSADYINRYTFTNHTICDVYVLIPNNDPIKPCLKLPEDNIIEGSEDDVLSRYMKLAVQGNATHIVRVTGDCPLIPHYMISKCITAATKNGFDYFSNVGNIGPESMRTAIDGHDVEVISLKALEWADKNAREGEEREHVTLVLRTDRVPSFIHRGLLVGHTDHSDMKLSIDTQEDLERARAQYEKVQAKNALGKKKLGKNSVHRF